MKCVGKVGGIEIEAAAGRQSFLGGGPCFCRSKSGEGDQMRPLAKLWGVQNNKYCHNFQNIGSKINQRLFIIYEPTLIRIGSDILKIVAVSVFCDTANTLSFFEIRVNFGRP